MALQQSDRLKEPRRAAPVLADDRDIELMIFAGYRKEDPKKIVLRPNGRRYEIERGKWVRVPMACLHALQDACVTRLTRVRPEDRGERVMPNVVQSVWIETEVPRFQWQWREIAPAIEPDIDIEETGTEG